MKSQLTEDFISCFRDLPEEVKEQARKTYWLWKQNPYHQSLQFKQVHPVEPLWSARVGRGWRVLGLREKDEITWFWIGSHADYDKLVANF